jgi:hypothetical protein
MSLEAYVAKLAVTFLDLPNESVIECMRAPESRAIMKKFSSSAEETVIYLSAETATMMRLTTEWSANEPGSDSRIAFIKLRERPIVDTESYSKQLQVVTALADNAPVSNGGTAVDAENSDIDSSSGNSDSSGRVLQAMQRINKYVFAPAVSRAVKEGSRGGGGSSSTAAESVLKKTRELDVALEQCQQATLVPTVRIDTELIAAALGGAAAADRLDLGKIEQALVLLPGSAEGNDAAAAGDSDKNSGEVVSECLASMGMDGACGQALLGAGRKAEARWVSEVSKLTGLVQSKAITSSSSSSSVVPPVFPNSLDREAAFWEELVWKLGSTQQRLQSPLVQLGLLVLRGGSPAEAGRLTSAMTDLAIASAIATESLAFIRELPMEGIRVANDLSELRSGVGACLQHFSRLREVQYPYVRATRLLRSVASTIAFRLVTLLRTQNVMYCPLDDFRKLVVTRANGVLAEWDSQYSTLRLLFKELARKRGEDHVIMSFERLGSVQTRVRELSDFREKHEHFLAVCSSVLKDARHLGGEGSEVAQREYGLAILGSLTDAYDGVAQLGSKTSSSSSSLISSPGRTPVKGSTAGEDEEDQQQYPPTPAGAAAATLGGGGGGGPKQTSSGVLDVGSGAGPTAWARHIEKYDQRLEQIESGVIRILTSRLSNARNTDEMFSVFSNFNSLLYRPAIYHAVNPFRVVLVKCVYKDIKRLREKFKSRYEDGAEKALADMRDVRVLLFYYSFVSWFLMSLSLSYPSITACLHSLTPHDTSLTIIPQSINHRSTPCSHYLSSYRYHL